MSEAAGTHNGALDLDEAALGEISARLEKLTAQERVAWAVERFRPGIMVTSSFGAQAAVTLHLATTAWPEIPVVLVDTGYLFPETYKFADELTERLKLNLKVYRSPLSPAWQEARWGKLWDQGLEGIERYNHVNKVEPMQRAVRELGVRAWISGLRRQQASSRSNLAVVHLQRSVVKINPIIDWNDKQVFLYLKEHGLPYHPLWEQGYVSIGDVHTTRPLTAELTEEQTRFFGLKRECGLHDSRAWEPSATTQI